MQEKKITTTISLFKCEQTIFFNAELSGLPGNAANSYQKLKAVRESFENFPGAINCGRYTFLETPLRIISIKESLFFDVDSSSRPGSPAGGKTLNCMGNTSVTEIKFE